MKNKIIILALVSLFVLSFASELSFTQLVIKTEPEQKPIAQPQQQITSQINKKDIEIKDNYIAMKATAYDLSIQCCGKSYSNPSRGITRDGYNLNNKSHSEAWTVSSNKFPMGTKLYLQFPESHKKFNGIYTVRDTGNFNKNVLDVYVGDFGEKVHQSTINFGRVNIKVLVVD